MTKRETTSSPIQKSLSRPAEDREKLTKRLLSDISEYYENFSKPCPMKAISAKFSRAFRGDFYDVLGELEGQGKIMIEMQEHTAAKVIYPGKRKK